MENGDDGGAEVAESRNLGRIFVILLLLHVFVIGAIILFNVFFGEPKSSSVASNQQTASPQAQGVAHKVVYKPEDVEEFRISSGQNLDAILKQTGTTRELLFALNGIEREEDFVLQVGKKILVPKKKENKTPPIAADQAQQILAGEKPALVANELMAKPAVPAAVPVVNESAIPVASPVSSETALAATPVMPSQPAAPAEPAPSQPAAPPVQKTEVAKAPEAKPAPKAPEQKKVEPAPAKPSTVAKTTTPEKPSAAEKPVEKKPVDKTKLVDKSPAKPATPPSNVKTAGVHVVEPKETFYSISRIYKVNVNKLMEINGIKDPNRLGVGTKLKIPAKD